MKRYQYLYEEDGSAVCVDVNECTAGNHMCSPDAQCINQEGSHTCQCRAGFSGDGRLCESNRICFVINYRILKLQLPYCGNISKSIKFLLLIATKIILTSDNILG